jgi:hypothetical protein
VECLVECLVVWVAWVEWVEWVCSPPHSLKDLKNPRIIWGFFLVFTKNYYEVSYKFLRTKLHNN